jgi:hypothetical protein
LGTRAGVGKPESSFINCWKFSANNQELKTPRALLSHTVKYGSSEYTIL